MLNDEQFNLEKTYLDQLKSYRLSEVALDYKSLGKRVSNEYIQLNDQKNLLEYIVSLDEARGKVRRPSSDEKASTIPVTGYKYLNWNFFEEFWADERDNLRVSVQSRCNKGGDQ
ncbi:MAG: hypothetical protein R2827_15935 [Bdellovibrionales bacterium]